MAILIMFFLGLFNGVINSWVTLPSDELAKVNQMCQSNGEIEKVRFVTLGQHKVFCKDGAEFKL